MDASHTASLALCVGEWVWPTLLTVKDTAINLGDAKMIYILCLCGL